MAVPKLQVTRNYRLFFRSTENRDVNEKAHKLLRQSMEAYGFLDGFPIVCKRDDKKRLVVMDGQHRLQFAETLQLPVYYIVTEQDFRISAVNSTAETWKIYDYAKNHADNGLADYREVLEFSSLHGIPLGLSAALLAGTVSWGNVNVAFRAGEYKITDREWAHKVAAVYTGLIRLEKHMRSNTLILACMMVCRVGSFNGKRLLQNAERCRDKLGAYSNRDAYLDMLEEVYNYGRKQVFGLKAAAIMAMRARNVCQNGDA